jgi:hypothetical protein
MELLGQPAVAAVGQNGQRSIQIDIEPHFTGETIEVKEVDADTECFLWMQQRQCMKRPSDAMRNSMTKGKPLSVKGTLV